MCFEFGADSELEKIEMATIDATRLAATSSAHFMICLLLYSGVVPSKS